MFAKKARNPLIVDFDESFLAEIESDPLAKLSKPFIARTGVAAQLLLADQSLAIAGLFINLKLPDADKSPDGMSVVRFSKSRRINLPIYALVDAGVDLATLDLTKLGIKKAIQKPVTYKMILEIVAPHVITYDQSKAAATAKNDQLGSEVQATDGEFMPIVAKDFVAGKVSHFSIYAKSESGRFLKIVHAGDAFERERITSYLKKGVMHFYIRKEDQEQYLKYSEQISTSLAQNINTESQAATGQTMNYGQETLKFLASQGLSENRLYHAANFAENIHSVASKMSEKNSLIAQLLQDLKCYEHGVSVSMIASLVAFSLGIESSKAVQIVGISSLLHDIGLVGAETDLEYKDPAAMTEEEKKIFYNHPKVAAEMMAQIPGTHPTVIQALAQHHERRGKKSFDPAVETRPKAISGVAEIIGISDEFLKLVQRQQKEPDLDIKAILEREVLSGFSIDTANAFMKAIYPSKRSRQTG